MSEPINPIDDGRRNIKKENLNIALKWALVGLLLTIIYTMLNLYMNDGKYNPRGGGMINLLISLIIGFLPAVMCIKEIREKSYDGFISFGQAFKGGFTMSLINVLFSVLFMALFYNLVIDYDVFLAEQMDIGIQAMKDRGMSDEAIKSQMSKTPKFMLSQGFNLSVVALVGLFMQAIIVLIVAAILKRNRPANA